jgi:two-component system nitrogen regulation response regulator NtrX
MSILIVDDEKDIRELVGDILREEGYSVRLAANSDECIAAINADAPSLLGLAMQHAQKHRFLRE